MNLVGNLDADERRGVITASTGNHGQSIAMACQREGVPCTVVVPEGNNPDKNAAMRAYGATIVEVGRDFDEAREYVERVVASAGLRYVHSANEPMLIAGVATYALEIFEELPDVDVILVPIGGGSGACGCSLVRTLDRQPRARHRRPGLGRRRVHAIVAHRRACRRQTPRRRSPKASRRGRPST